MAHGLVRVVTLGVLLLALGLAGCKNMSWTPPDRSLDIPPWCEPYGCPKGGGP